MFISLQAEDNKTNKKNETPNTMEFCSEDEIFNNPRLKLLMLRQSGQPEFRAMRHIPMNEREIPKDILKVCSYFSSLFINIINLFPFFNH